MKMSFIVYQSLILHILLFSFKLEKHIMDGIYVIFCIFCLSFYKSCSTINTIRRRAAPICHLLQRCNQCLWKRSVSWFSEQQEQHAQQEQQEQQEQHRSASHSFASYRIASHSIASLRNASILEINNNTKEECKKCGEVWIRTSEMWSLKCNDEYRSDVRGVRSEVLDLMWRVWDL